MEDTKEEKKDESSELTWLGIGLGIIIGGIIIAIIMKSRSTQQPAPVSYVASTMFPNMPTSIQSNNPAQINNPLVSSAYKNNETWLMERGEDGLIKRITVERDVKQDADPGQE